MAFRIVSRRPARQSPALLTRVGEILRQAGYEDTDAHAQTFLEKDHNRKRSGLPPIASPEEVRQVVLGDATAPPTGTHVPTVPPQYAQMVDEDAMQERKRFPKIAAAWDAVRARYPHVAKTVWQVRPAPARGHIPFDAQFNPFSDEFFSGLINFDPAIEDRMEPALIENTLVHELVHAAQRLNYPSKKAFDRTYARRPYHRNVFEEQAYAAHGVRR